MTERERTDVAIMGGGLAGLTLALQLVRRLPGTQVTVIEPKRRPLPEACFKVGESTVEVGAHYFGGMLGFHEYFLSKHLRKNGLRFFCGAPRAPFETRSEMGPPEPPNVFAYQIDRGYFENDLRALCLEEGVDLREGWGVREVVLGEAEDRHRVVAMPLRAGAEARSLEARWVVDATGRRRLLAKQLGIRKPVERQASAAWFRVRDRIDVAELADPEARAWHERDVDRTRWLSTNHLTGRGYWVWVIPLRDGMTSVGVVAENDCHEFTGYSTPTAMKGWLSAHEPELAARLDGVPYADFRTIRDYRHDAERVFGQRWACVGEAGVFVDPLYSPGSDIIGLGNSIVTELVAEDVIQGSIDPARIDEMNRLVLGWARILSRTLHGGSKVFGSAEVLSAKLYWDYFYYWAFLCQYFFQRIYALGADEHRRFNEHLEAWEELNDRAQRILAAWSGVAASEPVEDFVGLPQPATVLSDLHLDLMVQKDPEATFRDMKSWFIAGEEIVLELLLRALRRAGPSMAAKLAIEVRLGEWSPEVSDSRLVADEAAPRRRRKLLSKPIRDMERSIGKNAPSAEDAPRLRELWSLALS